jgi:CobQ/CobB/MinD/ParA nucleotide binding domain
MPDPSTAPASTTTRSSPKTTSAAASSVTVAATKPSERTAHIILQGKGGVGKTLVSTLVAQFYQEKGRPIACYDTDPVNSSFAAFKALGAKVVQILKGRALNADQIDSLMHTVLTGGEDSVIDNGAASFVPFSDYLLKSDIPELAQTSGCQLVVHVVLAGGQSTYDTMKGLISILDHFPQSVRLVLWVNEFFGPFEIGGQSIETTPIYEQNRSRISGLVYLKQLDPELNGATLARMLKRHMTFAQTLTDASFDIVAKSRLMKVRRDIFEQLEPMLP